MDSKTKKKIRDELQEELEAAQQTLQKVETQLQENPAAGLGEGATGIHSWEMALARRGRVRLQIEKLQETLSRIKDDGYGRCETCGRAINPERLEILPTATQCARCANL
jgi:RNA polymerase-binding protein DksA